MALPTPRSLSPSKAESFTSCPLAFRFSAVDRLPEPPTVHTALGTLVHRALERLFWHHPAGRRSPEAATAELAAAWAELADDPDIADLGLDEAGAASLRADAAAMVERYFTLEDPDRVRAVGTELTMEADVGGVRLRGIIDRLDIDADGELVVVDYKTGRVPPPQAEQGRLAGVQLYALVCQAVLGRRPARLRLLYLAGPVVIEAVPTEQALSATGRRTAALWHAILRACATEDFRPRPSPLCAWCAFRSLCPLQADSDDVEAAC
jgi:putative RecB family exonuclease